ncbi:hypothetical protein MIND_00117000 [Mycena indigotica]|uniref:Uncharacterized protein n=1 Tax=Mycena indigotica TaxID=2126181 RepID=A0A8H6TFW4_9AGAR|nr:uncharacterized protein MIND_00117000 [Mycena indigotica]KAF7315997.1 hypothetical protein MIND_00117000 [Mycena indigotica]
MARPMYKCFALLLVVSLGLFFGLFFGLNYPEIVRHGWPLTRCTVLSSKIDTRYCCSTNCKSSTCQSAPSGSEQCGSVISTVQSGFSPDTCAANSSACPTQGGSVCDGGYKCCHTCCSTCQSCSTSCSGSGSCTQSCTSYSCNCYCCSSTSHLYCTLSCPVCYTVNMQVAYSSRNGVAHNVTYKQDFSTDVGKADGFLTSHQANSTAFCYYNPKDESQILYDVSFTRWKWAITAVFGMLPLAIALALFAFFLLVLPVWRLLRRGWTDMADEAAREELPRRTWRNRGMDIITFKGLRKGDEAAKDAENEKSEKKVEEDAPPPAYAPSTSNEPATTSSGIQVVPAQ